MTTTAYNPACGSPNYDAGFVPCSYRTKSVYNHDGSLSGDSQRNVNALIYVCSSSDLNNPDHACYEHLEEPQECVDAGGQIGALEFSAYTSGYPSGNYCVPGSTANCAASVVSAECWDTPSGDRFCQANVEFSGTACDGSESQCTDEGCEPAGDPPKQCYDSDNVYMGTVSGNASCPPGSTEEPQKNCYNPDGTLAAVVNQSESCPASTSTEDGPQPGEDPTDPTDPTEPTDPDGEGEGEGEGEGDGTDEGEGVEDGVTGADSCEDGSAPQCTGDPIQCFMVKQQWQQACGKLESVENTVCSKRDSKPFECKGSPIYCFIAKTQYETACEASDPDSAKQAIQKAINDGDIEFSGADLWGQLLELDQGEFNLADQFNIQQLWSDSGNAGTCPQPVSFTISAGTYEISFQPLCDLAGYLRPLVILAAMWISGSMLSQVLVGTRYTY
jgi:hypothetical protein